MEKQQFKQYKRKSISEMCAWMEDMVIDHVSISDADKKNGSPKEGDMIARNPKNHNDQWLVAKTYFEDNLEPIPESKPVNTDELEIAKEIMVKHCASESLLSIRFGHKILDAMAEYHQKASLINQS